MSNKTSIEWTDRSVNFFIVRRGEKRGWFCVKKSTECAHCYAEGINLDPRAVNSTVRMGTGLPYARLSAGDQEPVFDRRKLQALLRFRKRYRIFPCDMTDFFLSVMSCKDCGERWEDESHELWMSGPTCRQCGSRNIKAFWPSAWIQEALDVFDLLGKSGHTIQILTKRARRMWGEVYNWSVRNGRNLNQNVLLGFSAGDQDTFDTRWNWAKCLGPFADGILWVSYEPGIKSIDMRDTLCGWSCDWCEYNARDRDSLFRPRKCPVCSAEPALGGSITNSARLGWGVIGGESGIRARPFCVDFALSTLRHFSESGVPFFVKQLGRHPYTNSTDLRWPVRLMSAERQGVRALWPKLQHAKGGDWNEWPRILRVRQLPEAP